MKKALQNNNSLFLKLAGHKYARWDSKSINTLLDFSNLTHGYDYDYVSETGDVTLKVGSILKFATHEESISIGIRILLFEYIKQGASSKLVEELNHIMGGIRFRNVLVANKGETPKWEFIVDITRPMTPKENAAILFSHLLSVGALDKVKCCQIENCNRFFTGPPNRKWCSDKCGSFHRVREKRRRDKY
jgi:predicted RNA-binding Zn ribbon-like protein